MLLQYLVKFKTPKM